MPKGQHLKAVTGQWVEGRTPRHTSTEEGNKIQVGAPEPVRFPPTGDDLRVEKGRHPYF